MRFIFIILALMVTSCVKHDGIKSGFEPILTFSGRLLVLDPKHKFQVELDWLANEERGMLRLTHALSARVVFVRWQGQNMYWRDNDKTLNWRGLSEIELQKMGVLLPPWQLARIFLGLYPKTMVTKDNLEWKGEWNKQKLKVKWSNHYKRVELTDYKRGSRAVVIMNE